MLTLAFALSLAATPAQEAQTRYANLDYEGCVTALAPALSRLHGAQRAGAELYFGLCQFALGREAEARRHLDAALRIDPNLHAPAAASPKERELFDDVSRAVAASPRPATPAKKPPSPKPAAEPETHAEAEPPADKPTVAVAEPAPAHAPVATPAPAPTATPAPAPAAAVDVTVHAEPAARIPAAIVTAAALALAGTGTAMALNAKQWEAAGNSTTLLQIDTPRYATEASNRIIAADVLFGVAAVAAALAVWLWIRAL